MISSSEVREPPTCAERPVDAADFHRALVQGMRCGILAVDHAGRILVLNEQAAQILDLEPVPPVGLGLEQALAGHPQLVQMLVDSFRATRLANREELVLGRGTGPRKTIGYTLSRIAPAGGATPGGAAGGVAMFFKDLTLIEQKAERERLRDRLAALGQMAASLAHEIRNPLASIGVTCSLLRRRLGPGDPSRELLDRIAAEVARLNRTVTSSLEFVRPVSLQLAAAPILPVLDEAIRMARDRAGAPSIRIVTDFPEPIPDFPMDRAGMRQVFENLVLNALQATGPDGTVTLRARLLAESAEGASAARQSAWVLVQVVDDGPGIPDEDRDKIFHPFFTTKHDGCGIGLALAKKIVDCHRGLIDVHSAPGAGASFTVRLPAAHPTTED